MSAGNGQVPQSVPSPMGDRRPMLGEPGAPLSPTAAPPQAAYPNIPPPVQPTAPQVAPQPPQLPQPQVFDEVPVAYQAVVLDAVKQGVTIAVLQGHFPGLTENAIRKLAAQYSAQIWNGQAWEVPYIPAAPQSLQPGAVMGGLYGTALQPQQPPAPTPSAPVAVTASDRIKKSHYEPIAKLRAQGVDTSTIAQTLGLSPDAVMRAIKKLEKDAATAAKQPQLPHTEAPSQPQPVDPGAQAAQATAQHALSLKVGDFIQGRKDVRPLEEPVLNARGLAVDWLGTQWLVVQAPSAEAKQAVSGGIGPALLSPHDVPSSIDEGAPIVADGNPNPVGSYLQLVLDKVNGKLKRYGLRARFEVEIDG